MESIYDVRRLALPGTYHEKITSLGVSLQHFTRLKSLDLSRNAIESLAGLENLKMLETLNLYYNNISCMKELKHLQANTALQELDLRLNPVVHSDPDYRLVLVQMLPNLRTLDERAVRDLERRAALMFFGTDQAALQIGEAVKFTESLSRRLNPRAEHVKSLGRTPFCADDDDEALLTYASRANGNFISTKMLSGSTAVEAMAEEYTREDIRKMNLAYVDSLMTDNSKHSGVSLANQSDKPTAKVPGRSNGFLPAGVDVEELQLKYPNLYPVIVGSSNLGSSLGSSGKVSKQPVASRANLEFYDELDAYTSYKGIGHFTPNPAAEADHVNLDSARETVRRRSEENDIVWLDPDEQEEESVQALRQTDSEKLTGASGSEHRAHSQYSTFIKKFSDLADKYWNGSKSLMTNARFKKCMINLITEIETWKLSRAAKPGAGQILMSISPEPGLGHDLELAREQITHLKAEIKRLREKRLSEIESTLAGGDASISSEEANLKSALMRSQHEVSILRGRLEKVMDRCKGLEAVRTLNLNAGNSEIVRLQMDNENLQLEVEKLRIRLNESSHMEELANMLQESHKSLVLTNEHLLHELNTARRRCHDNELRHSQLSAGI